MRPPPGAETLARGIAKARQRAVLQRLREQAPCLLAQPAWSVPRTSDQLRIWIAILQGSRARRISGYGSRPWDLETAAGHLALGPWGVYDGRWIPAEICWATKRAALAALRERIEQLDAELRAKEALPA